MDKTVKTNTHKDVVVENSKDENGKGKENSVNVAVVEKRDPYDVMVELAAEYGEEDHSVINQ